MRAKKSNETGLYYYGARFYDPRFSFWFGVDQLVEKYPGLSPYNFVLNNPVILIDPDGREVELCCEELLAFLKKADRAAERYGYLVMKEVADAMPPVTLTNIISGAVNGENIHGEKMSGTDVVIEGVSIFPATKTAKYLGKYSDEVIGIINKFEISIKTSRAARREVMRKEGIPTSQTPVSQSKNSSGREYTYEMPKPGGGKIKKSVQQQTKDRSHPAQKHWEAGSVKIDGDKTRMTQHNRPKLVNTKSKANYD